MILDVDGVVIDSPHERAWREALAGLADQQRFTTAFYQCHVAGKPRMAGALAALEQLGVPDPASHATAYAERKQQRLLDLIDAREFSAFPDAVRFIEAVKRAGIRLAAASSSKNATSMMRLIANGAGTLLDLFDADVSGRNVAHGKPDPEIFLLAARDLREAPADCVVVEDATVGIVAARDGGMAALGVARHGDADGLRAAGADLVVTSLDAVVVEALLVGNLVARRG